MQRVRIVIDTEALIQQGHRLHLMAIAFEEARRFAETAGNTEHQAYWEGQRDLVAAIAKDVTRREVYETEGAEIDGPTDRELHWGMPFLPIPTPRDATLWKP